MALRRINHTFSIWGFDIPPADSAAQVERVRRALNDPQVKERIALGEMYGYFENRPLTDEAANPPASRTVSIRIADNGDITATEEILDTPTGVQLASQETVGAGSWVWAHSRSNGQPDFTRFTGIDYQMNPAFPLG